MPQAGGIARERGKKILVERIALAIDALLLGHLQLEAAALLDRIGQFAEAVGELDPAGIKLEALGNARIAGCRPRQRRFDDRIVGRGSWRGRCRDCGSIFSTSTRLKISRPAYRPSPMRMPAPRAARGKRLAVGSPPGKRRQQIDAGEALERVGDRQPLRRRERVGCRGRES